MAQWSFHCVASLAAMLPRGLSRQLSIYRLENRVKGYRSPQLKDLPAALEKSMDSGRVRRLWEEVREDYQRNPTSAAKYAMPRQWLLLNTLRAADLRLHESQGMKILDIGCGPAYFLALTRALGHETQGVDAPESYLTPVERRVYSTLIDILHVGSYVSPLLIERFVPLPYPDESYDLITAFWICFNRHRQPDEWGPKEWQFFVEDSRRKLLPSGRLFLDLNENPERYGDLRFYDVPTLDYFRSVGSVQQGRVIISRE